MSDRIGPIAAALLTLAGIAPPAFAMQGPDAYVATLYADKEHPGAGARYSPRLEALWGECQARAASGATSCLDFNMFAMAEAFALSDVAVRLVSDNGRTQVAASFNNGERDVVVNFLLKRSDQGWMIEEMASGCVTLSGLLQGGDTEC